MNDTDFMRLINQAFAPFLRELGFAANAPAVNGRFYRTDFTGRDHTVAVSFEPGDNAVFIFIFSHENGKLSDIDDPAKTPRLSDLNDRYFKMVSKDELEANESAFASVVIHSSFEKLLLKNAKELRLVLPRYLRLK